jgi:two-component system cell cycle response regulator
VRILIAEDSAPARLILQRELSALGHECLVAEDGIAAWERFQGSGVDVVISDWMMPGLDGDELCRRVRSDPSEPYAYFVLLTSLQDRYHVVRGMEVGADDYLVKPFDRDELEARLLAAARVTTLHRRLAAQQAELEHLNAILFQDSRRDHLTGLGNRLRQAEDLEVLVSRSRRYGHTFAVALVDIDHFKAYNDTFGHLAGDGVLRSVASALVGQCRSGDTVYRYGGEEMLVVFAEQDLDSAAAAVERMRSHVEALAIPNGDEARAAAVTVSAGIAALEPADLSDVARLLRRADQALYEAKASGRNRVVVVGARVGRTT